MHQLGVAAFDKVRRPAVAAKESLKLFVSDARKDGGIGDLVAIEVKDGKNGAIADRIEKLVRVPAGGERPCLCLPVADNDGDDQVGIIERSAETVREAVSKLAAFVDGTGSLRCAVASD